MALSPQALIKGLVSRIKPSVNPDSQNADVALRQDRYGGFFTSPAVRKAHILADEGSYFTTNNAQTGLAAAANAAFTATAPFLLIQNTDNSGQDVRIYLDYIDLVTTAAGVGTASAAVYTGLAVVTDSALRYSSGGTSLTTGIVSVNQDITPSSVATIYAGTVTASAASTKVRTLCGNRVARIGVSTTVPDSVGDSKHFTFGGVESSPSVAGSGAGVMANGMFLSHNLPPVVIGPQQSCLIYVWYVGLTAITAASYVPELGWWER